jgi:hypothetical protein
VALHLTPVAATVLASAAFPALSCGVRRCPHPIGAAVGLGAVAAAVRDIQVGCRGGDRLELVEFVLGDLPAWGVWAAEARSMGLT